MKPHDFVLGGKPVGGASKVFVIAEIGINHDGCVDCGLRLIDGAADCGADAVKFQTFRADRLMVQTKERLAHQAGTSESAYEMFKRLELSWQDHKVLKSHADRRGILFLSTPFDEESADFLDELGVPAFKVASSDLTYLPLLRHLARKNKPLILSTGMSHLGEVQDAVSTLKSCGAKEIVLLHCVSSYPAPPDSLNLRAIQTLHERFRLPVGFSDHSQGILCALIAAALGAKLIEKHFTLDKHAPGPDHNLSMEPAELFALVSQLNIVEASLGNGCKHPTHDEEQSRFASRRSVVAAVDVRKDDAIQPWMVTCKRPGGGIDPREIDLVIGARARANLPKDRILKWTDIVLSGEAAARDGVKTQSAAVCSSPRSRGENLGVMKEGQNHA